ncbi:MAG: hypothetical protein ACK4F9_07545 [Brevinematia bacterium]
MGNLGNDKLYKGKNVIMRVFLFQVWCVFFLFLLPSLYGIKVNEIRVFGNEHTKRETILQISSEFLNEKDWEEKELEMLARRVEERLINTTWFYSAQVSIVPSKRGEEYRNVIIEVTEGFLLRFDGGYAYGMFGMDNIGGSGEKLLVYLGYNRQGVSFLLNPFLYYFFVGGRIGNFNDSYYSSSFEKIDVQKVGVNLEGGYRFSWDSKLALSGGYEWVLDSKYQFIFHNYFIRLQHIIDTRDNIFSAFRGYRVSIGYDVLRFQYPVFGVDARIFIPIYESARLAFRGSVEEGRDLPQEYKRHLGGIDGIRSDGKEGRLGNVKIQLSMEGRIELFRTSLLGLFNISFELAGFWDVGKCFENVSEIYFVSFSDYVQGFGGGIRVYFLEPVFLTLRFEVGFDKTGVWKVFLDMNEPF